MDVAKAFTYVTEDERWLTKLGIGAAVSFISFLIIPIPILVGYSFGITRNVKNGVKLPLPEWDDFGQLFRDGLAIMLAQIVYTLPFWLLSCIAFFATVGISGLSEVSEEAAVASIMATFGLVGCLSLLFGVALLFISPAIIIQYVHTEELGSLFRFGEVVAIARRNVADILIAFLAMTGVAIALSVVFGVLSIIPCLGWLATMIISIFVGPYLTAVSGHLYGQISAKDAGKGAGF